MARTFEALFEGKSAPFSNALDVTDGLLENLCDARLLVRERIENIRATRTQNGNTVAATQLISILRKADDNLIPKLFEILDGLGQRKALAILRQNTAGIPVQGQTQAVDIGQQTVQNRHSPTPGYIS